ncbi:MAG: single-stranded DNA-binding protein [Spirochaetes bacterium]|nr:MAG: single-stranded DNA-binding protein [Spirochaetota bacterium]RKX98279.1 MAG: single-stranded DNA-binding protein [Spirochaetota bacterium]
MSWDINHVILVGRLTRDPELTYTPSGTAVCRFSIAVNRSSGPSSENSGDNSTSYFNIVTWNKTAEICKEYLSKGKQVGIDGRLQQRRWEGQDGIKRSTVEIVASNVQFFGPSRITSGTQESLGGQQDLEKKPISSDEGKTAENNDEDIEPFISELDDDEIPF